MLFKCTDDSTSDSSSLRESSETSAYPISLESSPRIPAALVTNNHVKANHDSSKHTRWIDTSDQRMDTVLEESPPAIDVPKQFVMEPLAQSNPIDIKRSSTVLGIPDEGEKLHSQAHHAHDAGTSRSLTDGGEKTIFMMQTVL